MNPATVVGDACVNAAPGQWGSKKCFISVQDVNRFVKLNVGYKLAQCEIETARHEKGGNGK
jgi:hypothetical protein